MFYILASGKVISGRGTLGAIKGMWYQAHDCNSMTQPPIDLPTSDDARHSSLYRFAKQAEPQLYFFVLFKSRNRFKYIK